MNASLFRSNWTLSVCVFLGTLAEAEIHAEPFVPRDDQQILEKVRSTSRDPADRELRDLRHQLAAAPNNLELAARLAWRCLERSRSEGDPRELGHAQSALAPWWDAVQPPVEALVLRATIKQSQHEFTEALADLETATHLAPMHSQVWLTRATILTVLGRYQEARRCCLPLARLAPDLIAITAAANIASVTGQAEGACLSLRAALDRNATASLSERLWALTVLAETEARLGASAQAEAHSRRALSEDSSDVYLQSAFADFLLDRERPGEVMGLVRNRTRVDPLLLRLVLAESAANSGAALSEHLSALQGRFANSRLRGDVVHRREEARFTLHLLHQPGEALRLAEANWQVQREPADIRLLLEAALAAQDARAAAPALDFAITNRLQDVAVNRLAAQLNSLARK